MNIRQIDTAKDGLTLLKFRAVINYASGSPAQRRAYTFEQFREIWMNSRGPEEYLSALVQSMNDRRTIAEIWEDAGSPVAYVWASFTDWPEYNTTGAEIHDIMVAPEYQRRGIAMQVVRHVEKLARERGATLLRSGTGIENIASQGLHKKAGFYTQRVEFEKEL
jgi:ribosomal protein S18 acetylase RimI-like enzyme